MDEAERAVITSMQQKASCILCHRKTYSRGVFVPDSPQLYGAGKGKVRYIIYPICNQHSLDAETFDKIEDILLHGVKL